MISLTSLTYLQFSVRDEVSLRGLDLSDLEREDGASPFAVVVVSAVTESERTGSEDVGTGSENVGTGSENVGTGSADVTREKLFPVGWSRIKLFIRSQEAGNARGTPRSSLVPAGTPGEGRGPGGTPRETRGPAWTLMRGDCVYPLYGGAAPEDVTSSAEADTRGSSGEGDAQLRGFSRVRTETQLRSFTRFFLGGRGVKCMSKN